MHPQTRLAVAVLLSCAHLALHAQTDSMAGAADAYKKRDYPAALKALAPLVEQGNIEAVVMLGKMRLAGQGGIKDEVAAAGLLQRGADGGNAEAMVLLGRQMAIGNGLPKDEKRAVELYLKAAQLGNADGQHWYGLSLYRGFADTPADKAASVEWFRKAAAQGQASAQYSLGNLYDNGEGVDKNPYEALSWFRKAAMQFEPGAQRSLGIRYARGLGVARDDAEAFKWLHSAAYFKDLSALEWVATFYDTGRGVLPDPVTAYMWYTLHAARDPASANTKKALARLAEKLTPAQLTEAQNRAKQWPVTAEFARAITATGVLAAASAAPATAASGTVKTSSSSKTGSGFVMGSNPRYIVTNHHVVKDCKSIRVMPFDLAATVRAKDERNDLAVLAVPGLSAPALKIRTGRSIRPGDDLVTLGFPLAGLLASGASVNTGTLTNLGGIHNDTSRFQISVPTQPGNSGGPVLDTYGQVVGVVVAQLNAVTLSQTTGSIPQNINFAINTSSLQSFLEASNLDFDLSQLQQDPKAKKLDAADVGALGRRAAVKVECAGG